MGWVLVLCQKAQKHLGLKGAQFTAFCILTMCVVTDELKRAKVQKLEFSSNQDSGEWGALKAWCSPFFLKGISN